MARLSPPAGSRLLVLRFVPQLRLRRPVPGYLISVLYGWRYPAPLSYAPALLSGGITRDVRAVCGCSAPPSRVARRLAPVCARCRLPSLVALLPRSGRRSRSPPFASAPLPLSRLPAPTPAPRSALSPPPVKQNALLGIIALYQILIAFFWPSDLFEA